jgi:nucleotidyltransferase/DNA polymerase involved in DNA repair
MSLEDAISRHAGTIILDSDEPYYNKLNARIADALLQLCDRVEVAGLGVFYLRIDGFEAFHGGEARLIAALFKAVPNGLNPRIGVGHSKFPAFVAALDSAANGASKASEDTASFLRHRAVDLLPVPPHARARLKQFGFDTMGQVAALRAGQLQDEFGPEGRRIWELCNGLDRSPFVSVRREEAVTEFMSFPDWAISLSFFFAALDSLARRAFSRSEMRNRFVGKVQIECSMHNAPSWTKSIVLKQPAGNPESLCFAIRSNIDASGIHGLPQDVYLTLSDFSGEKGIPLGLLQDARERSLRKAQIHAVDQQLQTRTGRDSVLNTALEIDPEHPLPEMRAVLVSIAPGAPVSMTPLKKPVAIDVGDLKGQRPHLLLQGKRRVQIARATDLWKIDIWWTPKPISRTYYDLERKEGGLVTVFRDNLTDVWYQQSS